MKKIILIPVFVVLITTFFLSCEKVTTETEEENFPPSIISVTADRTSVYGGEKIHLFCVATDPDDNQITYEWVDGGAGIFYSNGSSSVVWEAPESENDFIVVIHVFVRDEEETATESISINVLANDEPEEPEDSEDSYYVKYVCDDAYVSEEYPDENYGDEPNLATGPGYYAYLRFDIQDVSDYINMNNLSSIEDVEIRMAKGYNNTAVKPIGTTLVYGISWGETLWMEEFINYNDMPQHEGEIVELQDIIFEVDGIVAFNVKDDFLHKVQVHNYYCVMITTPAPNVNSACSFYSKELGVIYPEYGDAATPVLWIKYKSN